ncbi:hypothetical protein [Candidatus Nitrosocosmicus sp. FF01]|uniref:hypothetical protein n=1 Tax=Candidatus Nitrosocosmicus sp. FF01 TaxID=3397670 RepID=UPI0039EA2AB3
MNKKQISIISIITVLTIAMTLSPLGSGYNFNTVFAGGNDHDDDDGNRASQIIAQVQRSIQNSQVVSGGDSIGSGNNFNFQNQENEGNNALAQDSDDDGDGNSASQAIVQSQSSEQNSQVVSGGDSIGSGNNFNFQNQENEGNNAIGQQ